MSLSNPTPAAIASLLQSARTIAVVGLSDNPHRPSHEVASVMRDYGHRIIPVNPTLTLWEGIRAVPDLDHVADVLEPHERIDIVDVFRSSEFVAGIVDDCIRLRFPALWLQLGVIDDVAAEKATAAGMTVVMNRCIKVDRQRIG
jgi:predicted CoA-binding protein